MFANQDFAAPELASSEQPAKSFPNRTPHTARTARGRFQLSVTVERWMQVVVTLPRYLDASDLARAPRGTPDRGGTRRRGSRERSACRANNTVLRNSQEANREPRNGVFLLQNVRDSRPTTSADAVGGWDIAILVSCWSNRVYPKALTAKLVAGLSMQHLGLARSIRRVSARKELEI